MLKTTIISILFTQLIAYEKCKTNQEGDYIVWREKRKLEYSDFKAIPPKETIYGGVAGIRLKLYYKIDETLKKFEVHCLFSKYDSWLKEENWDALEHEQKHFDIGEISARKLRKQLMEIKKERLPINYHFLDSLLTNANNESMSMQKIYDSESVHSRYFEGQERWNKKIDSELQSLKEFKSN